MTKSPNANACQSHPAAADTVTVPVPALSVKFWLVGAIVVASQTPVCVIESVFPAIVIAPVRLLLDVFDATL